MALRGRDQQFAGKNKDSHPRLGELAPAALGLLLPVLQHRTMAWLASTTAATCKLAHLIAAEAVVSMVQHLLLVFGKKAGAAV